MRIIVTVIYPGPPEQRGTHTFESLVDAKRFAARWSHGVAGGIAMLSVEPAVGRQKGGRRGKVVK